MTEPNGPELVEQLEAAIHRYIVGKMGDASGELAQMSLASLLIRWFNWQDRFPAARKRTVHESAELLSSQQAVTHASELATIKQEIEAGTDLTPRLSRLTNTPYVPSTQQGPLHQRADIDLLLSDWGIHHLHLGQGGARSGPLLFVVFRPNDAYLLLILEHGAWNDISLIETIARNWPDDGLLLGPLRGGLALAQHISAADRKLYRQGGVATVIDVDGKLYLPRGLTTGGTAIDVTTRSNVVMHALRQLRDVLAENPRALDEQVGNPPGKPGDWRPCVSDDAFGFHDALSGVTVELVKFTPP